jgi:DNA polymerase-3 subunit delta'
MLEHGRLAHAFLLVGPENIGKTAVAQALLKAALQTENLDTHSDLYWLKRETDEKTGKLKAALSVAQVRAVCDRLAMTSLHGAKKAVFIEEADRLNAAAANALLKTLEEPKGDALIVLRVSQLESVPATIASRCQVIRFHYVAPAVIAAALVDRGVAPADAQSYAALALGRPGLALRLVTDGEFRSELAVAGSSLLYLLNAALPKRLKMVADLLPKDEMNKAVVLERQLDSWERVLRDHLLAALGIAVLPVAASRPAADWRRALQAVAEARTAASHNVNPQLALEHVLLSI